MTRAASIARLWLLGAWLGLMTLARPSLAEVTIQTTLSSHQAEISQQVQVKIIALGDDGEDIGQPRLKVPPGFVLSGPSIGTQSQFSLSGSGMVQRSGISATWVIASGKTGKFSIGPATVTADGKVISGGTEKLEVVAKGTLPQRRSRRRGGLFDPFDDRFGVFPRGGLSGPNLDDLFDLDRDPLGIPPYPREFDVREPLDRTAFLRVEVSPRQAVVGEQVTMTVYAYGARGPFSETNSSEPPRPDFFTIPIIDSSARQRLYRVPIGERVWHAARIRQFALFPLKAGELEIGAMKMGFSGRGYPEPAQGQGMVRYSKPLSITVREPPLQGRPPEYQLGDVGRFQLRATVEPREVVAGGAVSVVATLKGDGNLPSKLRVPEQTGVEWLEPTISGEVGPSSSGTVGGSRTFTFVVRLDTPGTVDLGEVRLPFYSPQEGRYRIVTAHLGQVVVKPDPTAPTAGTEQHDALKEISEGVQLRQLLTLRDVELQQARSRPRLTDRRSYWFALFGGPLGLVGVGLTRRALGRWLALRRARRESSETLLDDSLRAARRAAKAGDPVNVAKELERALYTQIEAKTGIRGRALLRDELTEQLREAGADETRVAELEKLLEALEGARFAGSGSDLGVLVKRGEAWCKRFKAK